MFDVTQCSALEIANRCSTTQQKSPPNNIEHEQHPAARIGERARVLQEQQKQKHNRMREWRRFLVAVGIFEQGRRLGPVPGSLVEVHSHPLPHSLSRLLYIQWLQRTGSCKTDSLAPCLSGAKFSRWGFQNPLLAESAIPTIARRIPHFLHGQEGDDRTRGRYFVIPTSAGQEGNAYRP